MIWRSEILCNYNSCCGGRGGRNFFKCWWDERQHTNGLPGEFHRELCAQDRHGMLKQHQPKRLEWLSETFSQRGVGIRMPDQGSLVSPAYGWEKKLDTSLWPLWISQIQSSNQGTKVSWGLECIDTLFWRLINIKLSLDKSTMQTKCDWWKCDQARGYLVRHNG